MSEALRAAKRPAKGRVPASAAAVVFANPAEQMACLAADLAHGRASQSWWWTPLLNRVRSGGVAPGGQIARALTDSPADTPTAIAYLATWSELGAVLPTLSAPEAEAVLRTWAPHHDLRLPAASLPSIQQNRHRAHPSETSETDAPWSRATERLIPRGWGRSHRALAGLALEQVRAPHRTPSLARAVAAWWTPPQPANRAADAASEHEMQAPSPHESEHTSGHDDLQHDDLQHDDGRTRKQPGAAETPPSGGRTRGELPASSSAAPPESVDVGRDTMPTTDQRAERSETAPTRETGADLKGNAASGGPDPADASANPMTGRTPTGDVSPEEEGEAAARDSTAPEVSGPGFDVQSGNEPPAPTESARSLPDSPVPTTDTSETWAPSLNTQVFGSDLGGVIYLVNLLDALGRVGLPGREEGGSPPLATYVQGDASPWAVLEALTRALLTEAQGDAVPAEFSADLFPADPWQDDLWPALAHLDGRSSDTPAGADLLDMRAYAAPTAALAEVEPPDVALRWEVRGERVRVGSRQCLWAEGPAHEHPERTVEALLEHVHGKTGAFPGATLRRIPPSDPAGSAFPALLDAALPNVSPVLGRWTWRVLPLVTTRLREALGGSLDPSSPEDLASLLAIPATFHIEPMHLDVTLPLDAISLPVRMAGLDRSPGWLPSFGKVIQVHFEG